MRYLSGLLLFCCGLALVAITQTPLVSSQSNDSQVFLPLIRNGAATTPPPTGGDGDIQVSAATYLGGAGDDSTSAVDVALDGSIVLAGTMSGFNPGNVTPTSLLGGGKGVVVRLDKTGQSVSSVSRIGDTVDDLEIDDTGNIAVCGDFGVAMLNADARAVVWSATPGIGRRCATGRDGTTAVLVEDKVSVYNSTGTPLGNWAIGGSQQNDIAVDSVNALVIATGFTQVSGNLQLPFIRAWSYAGDLQWKSYDFSSAPGLGADTRGERIAMGRDGKLYFAGSINGGTGVSVFSRDPKDINVKLDKDRSIVTDKYTNPFNIGSVKMTWFGRFNPADGTLELGQSLLTRRTSDDKGNSIGVEAIAADADGRVYLAGGAACCIKERDSQQVAGVTVGSYESGEGYFFVVSPDFKERLIWTPFAAPGLSAGGSPATGVGVRDAVVAVGINLNPRDTGQRELITFNALQSTPGTLPEAYAAVWSFK